MAEMLAASLHATSSGMVAGSNGFPYTPLVLQASGVDWVIVQMLHAVFLLSSSCSREDSHLTVLTCQVHGACLHEYAISCATGSTLLCRRGSPTGSLR